MEDTKVTRKFHGGAIAEFYEGDFVSTVDGITFGVINGTPLHLGGKNWEKEDQIKWAKMSAIYFDQLIVRLHSFVRAVEKTCI